MSLLNKFVAPTLKIKPKKPNKNKNDNKGTSSKLRTNKTMVSRTGRVTLYASEQAQGFSGGGL